MSNYKSYSDEELLQKLDNLRNLAHGLEHLLSDPALGNNLGLPTWAETIIKQELVETEPVIAELQHRGYGQEGKSGDIAPAQPTSLKSVYRVVRRLRNLSCEYAADFGRSSLPNTSSSISFICARSLGICKNDTTIDPIATKLTVICKIISHQTPEVTAFQIPPAIIENTRIPIG